MKLTFLLFILVAVGATETSSTSTPINKLHNLVKRLQKWSTAWIGVDGRIGNWRHHGMFERTLMRTKKTFIKHLKRCNSQHKTTGNKGLDELGKTINSIANKCHSLDPDWINESSKNRDCAVYEGLSVVQGLKKLQRDYIECGGQRETRIQQRMFRLELVILSSLCQTHVRTIADKWNCTPTGDHSPWADMCSTYTVKMCKQMAAEANKSNSIVGPLDNLIEQWTEDLPHSPLLVWQKHSFYDSVKHFMREGGNRC